jgi:two-component system, cell cycle response regulator DivK
MGNTILCIEDNPDNMMLLRRILEFSGYRLLLAKTGHDGLSLAAAEDVDLILLDINLPDMDGYEIARRIRAHQKQTLAQVPIITISANALKGDAQKALAAGSNLYMTKPIDIHELSARVKSYLPAPK